MTQKLWFGALGGVGIVGVLFVIGFILVISKVEPTLGSMALFFAVAIGVVMGLLGIIGIIKKIVR